MEASLVQATASTFESLAFFFADPEPTEWQRAMLPDAAVRVTFQGPLSGALEVRLCGGLLPSLAANMLGEDTPPSASVQMDALGEVANVICGSVLPTLAGPAAVFSLGAPHAVALAVETAHADGTCWAVALGLDDGRAEVRLWVHGATEEASR